MKHKQFLEKAIQLAKRVSDKGGYPFGAVVVKDGEIIGDSGSVVFGFDPTAHAEVRAIRNACENIKSFDLSGCVIYSSCQPCSMCFGAIKWSGIKEAYWAFDKEDAKDIKHIESIFMDDFINIETNKIPLQESAELLKSWYDKQ